MHKSLIKNLVTGGSGFLGSHLIDKLMKKGEKVICLDNYFTGDKMNNNKWLGHENFEMIEHDVTKYIHLDADKIWHLACPASPIHYQFDPINTSKTIFLGTLNMLELAENLKAKILLASSSEIYGNPEVNPQSEDYFGHLNPLSIRSCYGEGKRICESLFFDFKRIHGLDIRIIRIFNAYGPRMKQNDGRVVSNFIVQALTDKPLTIKGNGLQTRSFCFVDDLIDGMIKVMNSNFSGPVNIGNNDEITIKELAFKIKNKINRNLKLTYKEFSNDDPVRRKPSIKLAKKLYGWEPKISLDVGLDLTIDYFKKEIFH